MFTEKLTDQRRRSLRGQTRRSLLGFNHSLMLRGVFDTVCGGTTFIFVAFALSLGIERESMARLTMAASLACLFQMLVLPLVHQVGDRKKFILRTAMLEPLVLMAAVLLVPLLPPWSRLTALVVATFAAASFLQVTKPISEDWLAASVPAGLRGKYLGRRFQLYSAVFLLATLLAGWSGDYVKQHDHPTWGLAILLTIGGVFGALSVLALSKAHMPRVAQVQALRPADVRAVIAHRPFRSFILGSALFNVPFFLGVPFYQVFFLNSLKMQPSWIAYLAVVYWLAKVAVLQFCGHWVTRWGPRRAVMLSGPVYVVYFAIMGLSQPDWLWPVFLAWAMVGVADGVWVVALPASLYATVPQDGPRPAFFAVNNLLMVGGTAAAAPFAELLVRLLANARISLGALELGQYHVFYLAMAALCAASIWGALMFPGKEATALSDRSPRPRPAG